MLVDAAVHESAVIGQRAQQHTEKIGTHDIVENLSMSGHAELTPTLLLRLDG